MAKCRDCGKACLVNAETDKEVGPSREWRTTGEPSGWEVEHCEARPRCFAGLVEFSYDPSQQEQQLDKQWNCKEFIMWRPGMDPKDYAALAAHEAIERRAEMHRWIGYAISIAGVIASIVTAYLTAKWTAGH